MISGGAQILEGASLTFEIQWEGRVREAFLLRAGGELRAYVNQCPHWAVELDLGDGHFYDPELNRIYCKNHGALFFVDSGVCETGPCLGRALSLLPLAVEGEDVRVTFP